MTDHKSVEHVELIGGPMDGTLCDMWTPHQPPGVKIAQLEFFSYGPKLRVVLYNRDPDQTLTARGAVRFTYGGSLYPASPPELPPELPEPPPPGAAPL